MSKKNQGNGAKRIVAVASAKGGIGKSKTAIGLADFYSKNNIRAKLVDADIANKRYGSFKHVFPEAAKIDVRSPKGLDVLIDLAMQKDTDIVLMDMGSGAIDELSAWFKDVAATLRDANVRLTICSPLTSELATLDSLLRITEAVGDNASYVIVRNHGKGDTMEIENLNSFKDYLTMVKPDVITMNELRLDVAEQLDLKGLSPERAIAATDEVKGALLSSPSARIRMIAWGRMLGEQIIQTESLLPA
jgi:MinD-like ATPase involved in chromosome partitioning or flagellar assembly